MISATLPGRADDRPIAEVLRALRPDHPRLYVLDEEIDVIKQQIKVDARLRRWYDRLQKDAERMLKEPVVVHRLIGPRLLDQSRAALRRISTLAGLYRLDGDHRKADRARQEMLAAAAFPDWNPAHFLDVAEMTNALAIGYDWLYQFLTDADRARIRQAIVEKGLKPGLLVYKSGRGWPMVIHNWNQVCNGGLTAGALAVADREPDLAGQLIDHARRSIVRAMASFAPDGGWAEGPGYWNYATECNVFFLSAVESALGTDFGLKQMAGFRQTGKFRMQSIGPLNRTFNRGREPEPQGSGTAARVPCRLGARTGRCRSDGGVRTARSKGMARDRLAGPSPCSDSGRDRGQPLRGGDLELPYPCPHRDSWGTRLAVCGLVQDRATDRRTTWSALRDDQRQPPAAPGTAAGRREPDHPLDRDAECSPGGRDHSSE